MDKNTEIIILYDYYQKLLNEKEQMYFENYYFENLTLQEISENSNVSRNNIHKTLKNIEKKLNDYESKLELYKKNLKLEKILSNLNDSKLVAEIKKNL